MRVLMFSFMVAAAIALASPSASQSVVGGPSSVKNLVGGAKATPNLVVPPVRGSQVPTAKATPAPSLRPRGGH